VVTDILIAQPQRHARESGRALVKGVAKRLLGKKGLDRAKAFWAIIVPPRLPF